MNVLGWIVFGFVVGLVARLVLPGKESLGMIGTLVIGILGALLGGWLGQGMGLYAPDDGEGFIFATLGAALVVGIYFAVSPKAKRKPTPIRPRGPSPRDYNRPAA